jgi:hypothetical protein
MRGRSGVDPDSKRDGTCATRPERPRAPAGNRRRPTPSRRSPPTSWRDKAAAKGNRIEEVAAFLDDGAFRGLGLPVSVST